jgi:hypothetical protein
MSAEKFHKSAWAHKIAFAELPVVQKYQLVDYILVGSTVMLHSPICTLLQCSGLLTTESSNISKFNEMGCSPTMAPIVQIIGEVKKLNSSH